ncbi:MAG: hypothetical protein C0501_24035 [Isosphaera sp.]|nr:hypothetical protein [Isosphaera sp.]
MGSISFLLPSSAHTAPAGPDRGPFFAHGYEQTVAAGTVEVRDGILHLTKPLDDSGYLLAPWPVGPFGTLVAATSTLRERPEPYRLLLELARGKLNQVRTQAAEWQGIGLITPRAFDQRLADATRQFGKALVSAPADADAHSARVLEESFALADVLAREFVAQLFDTRHQEEGPVDSRLAARSLGGPGGLAGEYARAFNAAAIGLRWGDIEPEESRYDWSATDRAVAAAKAADLPITMGPVIDLAPGMLPVWAAGWEGDLPTLAAFTCDFLETAVRRYKTDVRRWVVCAGFNHADALGLGGDERVRLAFRLFEAAHQADPHLELVLSVAQPWGEYLGGGGQTVSPLAFPDDLIRAGLKVSGVELEIRPGVTPRGSLPRDLLDTVRLIHLFGSLGVPLELTLSLPSSPRPDPAAVPGQAVWAPAWPAGPSPDGQAEWGASFAALGLSIPHVRAVTWDHWADSEFHLTPGGGLVGTDNRPKPLLARLRTLRTAHLR